MRLCVNTISHMLLCIQPSIIVCIQPTCVLLMHTTCSLCPRTHMLKHEDIIHTHTSNACVCTHTDSFFHHSDWPLVEICERKTHVVGWSLKANGETWSWVVRLTSVASVASFFGDFWKKNSNWILLSLFIKNSDCSRTQTRVLSVNGGDSVDGDKRTVVFVGGVRNLMELFLKSSK